MKRRSIGSVILDVIYGYETKPENDEWVDLADQVMTDFSNASKYVRLCIKPDDFS